MVKLKQLIFPVLSVLLGLTLIGIGVQITMKSLKAGAGDPSLLLPGNTATPDHRTYLPEVQGGQEEALTPTLRAGLRASSYGIEPFPESAWWLESTRDMARRVGNAAPAVVWIVGVIDENDNSCLLNFPPPQSGTLPEHIVFDSVDFNEPYLQAFDAQGVKVWLQVEPGVAEVGTLIDLVLDRYAHHSSVIGVGVDVEWYRNDLDADGKPVTDAEARAWVTRIREHNSKARLFLKHWETLRMPPTYRDGVVFIDDSQQLSSLEAMVDEFTVWGETFAPAPVGFQFGYEADRIWWQTLDNPPQAISRALRDAIPNATDFFWVDFTATEIWPVEESGK